jgi:hypothetical protein
MLQDCHFVIYLETWHALVSAMRPHFCKLEFEKELSLTVAFVNMATQVW